MKTVTKSIFENTGGLLATQGRPSKGMKPKARKVFSFAMTDKDGEFLENYCKILGMTRTEAVLRGLSCMTGYNGRNGKQILKELHPSK